MHLLDQRALGFVMLLLLSTLVITKHLATGSILRDKPSGGSLRLLVTHTFNLFFLLIVNPIAAMLLITQHVDAVDQTHIVFNAPWLLMAWRSQA